MVEYIHHNGFTSLMKVRFLLLVFLGVSTVVCAEGRDATASSQTLSERLARIDEVFESHNYSDTESLIKSALKVYPNNAELLWRYSNLMINAGDVAKNREPYYKRAVKYAEAAVKADPKNANAHAFVAASYGSIGMFVGGEEKVKLAHKIRDELDVALRLDPDNFVAHTIYGTYHREVSDVGWIEKQLANMFLGGLPEASYEKSVYHFNKANEQNPNVLRNRYELGLTYISMDKETLALREFRRALKCPVSLKADKRRVRKMRAFIEENS